LAILNINNDEVNTRESKALQVLSRVHTETVDIVQEDQRISREELINLAPNDILKKHLGSAQGPTHSSGNKHKHKKKEKENHKDKDRDRDKDKEKDKQRDKEMKRVSTSQYSESESESHYSKSEKQPVEKSDRKN